MIGGITIEKKKRDSDVTGGGPWQRERRRALKPTLSLGGCETLGSQALPSLSEVMVQVFEPLSSI